MFDVPGPFEHSLRSYTPGGSSGPRASDSRETAHECKRPHCANDVPLDPCCKLANGTPYGVPITARDQEGPPPPTAPFLRPMSALSGAITDRLYAASTHSSAAKKRTPEEDSPVPSPRDGAAKKGGGPRFVWHLAGEGVHDRTRRDGASPSPGRRARSVGGPDGTLCAPARRSASSAGGRAPPGAPRTSESEFSSTEASSSPEPSPAPTPTPRGAPRSLGPVGATPRPAVAQYSAAFARSGAFPGGRPRQRPLPLNKSASDGVERMMRHRVLPTPGPQKPPLESIKKQQPPSQRAPPSHRGTGERPRRRGEAAPRSPVRGPPSGPGEDALLRESRLVLETLTPEQDSSNRAALLSSLECALSPSRKKDPSRLAHDLARSEEEVARSHAWLDGERVWVVHRGGFCAGRLLAHAGDGGPAPPPPEGRVRIQLEHNGELIDVDEDDVEKANPPTFDRCEDLSHLRYLNESSILHTLRQRYGSNLIHTYAGATMVVLNPTTPLAIYSEKVIQMFRGCKPEDMPPHIYSVGQATYRDLINTRRDQGVVFLGRSGSGKTTNFRHVLHYLALAAGASNKVLTVEKLNAISTLLEAFGNCRTVMNTNATRFTQIFSLDFDHSGQIVSASVQVYMPEKMRVVRRPPGEPNYHVFYQLLSGADDDLKSYLGLDNPVEPNLFLTPLQRTEDKQRAGIAWARIRAALDVLKVSEEEQRALWSVLAALYHLGTANVIRVGDSNSGKLGFAKPSLAQKAASLLGTSVEELARTVFAPAPSATAAARNTNRTGASSPTDKGQERPEGLEALEGIAAGLYAETFNAIVALINRCICTGSAAATSIVVVDSPGFQNPASCGRASGASFADLCHNYAHERLHLLFHDATFTAQADRYAQEKIECEEVTDELGTPAPLISLLDKPSSSSVVRTSQVDLPEAERRGLLWLLDEEALFPGASDLSFLKRLFAHYGEREFSNLISRGATNDQFVLHHFQGTNPVSYCAQGWLRASRENPVTRQAAVLLQESNMEILSRLFVFSRGPVTKTVSGSVSGIECCPPSSQSLRRAFTTGTATFKRKSVCLQVKFTVDGIIETLRRTRLKFVHCLLPQHNAGLCDHRGPPQGPTKGASEDDLLNVPLVRSQIRGSQILEALRLHKQGFPEHLQYPEFRRRFAVLAPAEARGAPPLKDERGGAEALLPHLDLDSSAYRLGLSQIFFRTGTLSRLEEERDLVLADTVVRLQALCRGVLARRAMRKRKVQETAIRCIQKNVRKFLAVREWPWWRLLVRVAPLLNVHRTEEELRATKDELEALLVKLERAENDRQDLKHENDKLEAKLVAMEVPRGASGRSWSVEPSADALDDLSSGSEEEFFDVHPSPGFCIPGRPQINPPRVQGPIVSGPLVGSNRGRLPVHSHSLPSIDKIQPSTQMGNLQPGTVPAGGTPQDGLRPHAVATPSPEPPPLGIRMSASKTSLNTNSLKKKYAAPPVPSVSREPSFKRSGPPRSPLNDSLLSVDSCSVAETDGSPASRKPHRNPSFKKYRAPPPPPSPIPKADLTTQDNAGALLNGTEPPGGVETAGPLLESVPCTGSIASLSSDAPGPEATAEGGVPESREMSLTPLKGEGSVPGSSPPKGLEEEGGPLTNGFEEGGCSEGGDEKQRPEDSSSPRAEERTELPKKKKKKTSKAGPQKSTKAPAPNPIDKPASTTGMGSGGTAVVEEKSVGSERGKRSPGDKAPSDSKGEVKERGSPPPSGAATPERKSKVVYKRAVSGKLASLANKFEAEDKTPATSKSGSNTKVGKLGVLTSKFSGDKCSVSAPSERKGSVGERIFPMGSVGDVATVFEKNVRKKSIGGIDISKFGSFVKPVDYLKTKKEIDPEKSHDIDPSSNTEGSNNDPQVGVAIDPIAEEASAESPTNRKSTGVPETVGDLSKETGDPLRVSASDQTKVFAATHQTMGEGEPQVDIETKKSDVVDMSEGRLVMDENVAETGGGLGKPPAEDSASLSMIPSQNEPGGRVAPVSPANDLARTKELVPVDEESKLSQLDEVIKVASFDAGKEFSPIDPGNKLAPIDEGSKVVPPDPGKVLAPIDAVNKLALIDEGSNLVLVQANGEVAPLADGVGLALNFSDKELVPIDTEVTLPSIDSGVELVPIDEGSKLAAIDTEKESVPHRVESPDPSKRTTEDQCWVKDPAPQTGDSLASAIHPFSASPDSPQEPLLPQATPVGSPSKEVFEDALEALTHLEASENVTDMSAAPPDGVGPEVKVNESPLSPVASDSTTNHGRVSGLTQSHDSLKISVDLDTDPPLSSLKGNDCVEDLTPDAFIPPGLDQPIVSEVLVVESKVEPESDVTNANAPPQGPLPSKVVLGVDSVQSGTGRTVAEENEERLSFEGIKCTSPLVANEAAIIGWETKEASCLSLTPFYSLKDVAAEENGLSTDNSFLPLKPEGLDRNSSLNDVTGEESRLSSHSFSPPLKLVGYDRNSIASLPLGEPSKSPDMLDEVHQPIAAASTSQFPSSLQPSLNSSAKSRPSCDVYHAKTMTTTSTASSVAPTTLAQMSESVLTLRGCGEKRPTLSFQLWNNNREEVQGTSAQRCSSQMNSPNLHPAFLGVSYFPQTRSLSDLTCNQKGESPVATPTPPQLSVRPKVRRRSYDKPLPDEVLNISEILRDVEARLSKAVAKPEPVVARPNAYDLSSLDTLMPLPDPDDMALGERRSRSSTPFRDRSERSPTPNPVFKQTEALLTETDRILRKTRSHHSLRRSFTRSLSGVNIHRLTEVTADLNEEHTTAQLASERIEAEQSDRMRLEKEVTQLQAEIKRMTTTNDKLEMERLHLKHEVLQHADLNGEVEGEPLGDTSLYKRKYEWCLREIDVLKKQLKQQQEDDLDQMITLKKQLEKKVADAVDESDGRRQVVAQVKKKSQRLQAEMNDLKILLEEQTSRNNLLEKKQRKFDQDMASLVDDQRTERSAKEKIQRERDQILAEKYSFEQEVATLKLELELKDEKLSSVNKELDDLNFSGKVDEEVALLKKAKHDLELRVKDQEEELDDLAGQVQMLESAKVRLEMSIEQMRKENRKELSQRDEEVEEIRLSAQKKVKALEAQLEGEHEERTHLVRAKHELERRLVEAHSRGVSTVEEDAFHRLKKELRKTKALLKDTQTMLEKTQAEGSNKLLLRQLKTQLEDAEFAKMAAIKAKQCGDSDLSEVQTQLEEVQRSRKETEERLTRVTKEKSEMQTQLEESEEEAAEVMKKYKATVSQLSVDQISISEQAQLIADLEHDKQVLQDKLSELSSKVEVLEGETANIHTQRRLQMKIKELESKLDLESTTRQRLESQIARLKDQVERVSSDGDSLRLKESQTAEHAKKLSRQLREAKEDVANLQARLTDALSRRQEVEKQYELAESEIVTLKGDLKLAFKRIEDLQQALQGDISDSDTEISDSGSENEASLGSFLTGTNNTPYRTTSPDSKGDLMGPSINDLMSVIKEDVEDDLKESFA